MENKRVSGWNMLDSYSEGQAIYGRDTEIASIKESVLYNIQTFLYGKSGIGKTSLLQAGVFPELRRANYFPVVIRLAFYNNEPLNRVVKRLVEEEAESENLAINKVPLSHYVIDDTDVTNCSLYEYFAKVRFEDESHTPYIPVLVLDQFEETINNEEQWQRTVDFLKDDLYSLMDNSNIIRGASLPYTNYRVVFSMREDYLYCLEDIVDRFSLWELRYNRFRIKALDDERAEEVIRRTSGVNGLEYGKEEKIIKLIIQLVKNNSGTRFTEINTALLSLICSLLHENAIDGCIRYNDLRKVNTYINSYYDAVCAHIGGRATRYLEQHLLTADGRRSSIDETEALASHKIKPEHFDYLVEKRLVRKIKTDSSSARYEYIHDLYAKIVHKRMQEDKGGPLDPAYSSISRSLDRVTFIKQTLAVTITIGLFYAMTFWWHLKKAHPTIHFKEGLFQISVCVNNVSYLAIFALVVCLIPLCVKRLHDYNLSGWNLLLLPIIMLLWCSKYYLIISEDVWTCIMYIAGGGIILYLLHLIETSSERKNYEGYSKEYEAAWKGATISNLIFAKMLSIELFCWVICCIATDFLHFSVSDYLLWKPFYLGGNLAFLDKVFEIKIYLPMVLSLLPLVLCYSCAIRARVKSIGGYKIYAYIPYINIIFIIIGLLPDQLLKKLKIYNNNKSKTTQDSDDILIDNISTATICQQQTLNIAKSPADASTQEDKLISAVHDDLIAEPISSYKQHKTTPALVGFLMFLVPFYGIIRATNKKNSTGARVTAAEMAAVPLALYAFLGLMFCVGLIVDDNIALCWKILGCAGWCAFFTPIIIVCRYRLNILKRGVIAAVEAHPTYTPAQIGGELQINHYMTESTLITLIKKGVLSREEIDGVACWKVNEKPKHNRNNTTSFIIGLLMFLVPFYGIIRALNKKYSIGARVTATQMAVAQLALFAFWGLTVCLALIFDDIALCWKILGCVGWCALLTLLIVVCRYRSNILKRGVIATIEAHPTYTQAQIGGELQINDYMTERTLKKLIQKGVLSREEIDGVVCWKVNEKPKNKMNKTIEN